MTSCPRCQAALPDPPERFCPSCGADLEMTPPPIPPAIPPASPGWSPGSGARAGTPWERRNEIGLAAALIETTQRVLTAPSAFFRDMAVTGGIGAPLVYALIIGYAGVVISAIYDFVLASVMGSGFSRFGGANEAMASVMPYFEGVMGLGMKLIFGPVFLVISLFLLAGIVHLALMALGGAARGFEATFRVTCYSEASALLNIVPVCGGVLAPVVMIVLMVIGIAEAHGTTRGRAAAAVLLPILLCCCCLLVPLLGGAAALINRMQS
jgi:hypothetical protein